MANRPKLSDQDRAILMLEATAAGRAGEKERQAREDLRLSATEYYQLNALLDRAEALAEYPVTVNRLRRLRDRRTR